MYMYMKKIFSLLLVAALTQVAMAQNTPSPAPIKVGKRSADHIMLQVGSNFWMGMPDSVSRFTKRLNRSVGVYAMFDKQFKTMPKLSVGFGLGIGVSNMYFNRMELRIDKFDSKLPFIRTDTGNNYKKFKLATAYLELPVELRYMTNPTTPNKSWKIAIGAKIGTLVNAHTRARTLQNAAGTAFNKNSYKVNSKNYISGTRLAATVRFGYGIYSVFGTYNFTSVFKDGAAADIKGGQVGFCISGL
jgi:hypothetical protein